MRFANGSARILVATACCRARVGTLNRLELVNYNCPGPGGACPPYYRTARAEAQRSGDQFLRAEEAQRAILQEMLQPR